MAAESNDKASYWTNTRKFAFSIIVLLIVGVTYVTCGWIQFHTSSDTIRSEYERNLFRVDSMYIAHIEIARNLISDSICSQNDIKNILQIDSCMLERERLLAVEEQRVLLGLHIDKVDNEYTVITIWGAILSVLFIVFSFFSIYKIEDTKEQMEKLRKEVAEDAKEQLDEIKKEVGRHRKNAESMSKDLNVSYKKYNDFLRSFEDKWNDTLEVLKRQYEIALGSLSAVAKNAGINTQKTDSNGTDR